MTTRRRFALAAFILAATAVACDDAFLVEPPPNPHDWWDGFDAGGFNNYVFSLHEHNGALYAGGSFTRSGDTTVNGVARWDGNAWLPLASGVRRHDCTTEFCPPTVASLGTWRGMLVAGGRFTVAGGEPSLCIAAWDGTLWHPFGSGLHGSVNAVVDYAGVLVAGGDFTTTGDGTPMAYLAAWDGTRWLPFGGGLDGVVRSLALVGGDLVVAGEFSSAGGVPARRLARWDGSGWTSMAQARAFGEVTTLLAVDNVVMAAGTIDTGPDPGTAAVARWDGEVWTELGDGICCVDFLCMMGNRLVASRRSGSTGSLLFFLDHGTWVRARSHVGGQVRAMQVHDGRLFVGGTFLRAGDKVSRFIARWDSSTL